MPMWNHLNFQNSNTPTMEQLILFHDHTMMILITITLFIIYFMIMSILNKNTNKYLMENQQIETIWTMIPAFILILITIPSLRILYLMEEIFNPIITIKSIGHQWYWSYEYSDFNNIEFDSFMMPQKESLIRLLEVDNRMIIPMNNTIRIITTSMDVIHSWTIPSLGVKMDSIPGRINQSMINPSRPGIYVGQCSEICGSNHSFMPIIMESIKLNNFINWIKSF
uniref:Cytochrome c oxidase subunit 2 n=1 Tax=Ammothea carolinensis TaxID=648471 RepID=E3SHE6_AMMCA|nr:cytochrome c oxidase subunit II [Ammothea carolinensis]ACY00251.1 cytochrome c oxidase subunit II [Ammothea carolinensis]